MMTHKDCEEWAAMIAQMQDDPSWHPKWNPKGVKQVKAKRGPNDLEEIIERLDLRTKIKKLEHDAVNQLRNKGKI